MGNGQSEIYHKRFVDQSLIESSKKSVWHMVSAVTCDDISKMADSENEKLLKQEAQLLQQQEHSQGRAKVGNSSDMTITALEWQSRGGGEETAAAVEAGKRTTATAAAAAAATPAPPRYHLTQSRKATIARAYTHSNSGGTSDSKHGGGLKVVLLQLNPQHHFVLSAKGGPSAAASSSPSATASSTQTGAAASAHTANSSSAATSTFKPKYRPALIARYALEWLMQNPHHGVLPLVDVACFGDHEITAVTTSTNLHPALRVLHRHNACEILYGLANIAEGLAHLHKNGFCHRNVGWHSVVVNGSTTQRYWQLSEFQFAVNQRVVLANKDKGGGAAWLEGFLSEIRLMKEAKQANSVAVEDKDFPSTSNLEQFFEKIPIGACDVYSFGQIIEQILPVPVYLPPAGSSGTHGGRKREGHGLGIGKDNKNTTPYYPPAFHKIVSPFGSEDCSSAAVITTLREFAKQCQHEDPHQRPKITDFLDLPCVSRGVFTKIMLFCDHIGSKSEEERVLFFNFLHLELMKLPYEVVVSRLIPRFLTISLWRERTAEPFLRHLLRPLQQKFTSAESTRMFKVPLEPKILEVFRRALSQREDVEAREKRRAADEAEAAAFKAAKGLEGTSATGGLKKRGKRGNVSANDGGGGHNDGEKEGEGEGVEEGGAAHGGGGEERSPADGNASTSVKVDTAKEQQEERSLDEKHLKKELPSVSSWVDLFVMEEIGVLNQQEFHKLVARQLESAMNPHWVAAAPPSFTCLVLRQVEFFVSAVDMSIIFDSALPFAAASLMSASSDVSFEALRAFSSLVSVIFNAHEKQVDTRDATDVIRGIYDKEVFSLAAREDRSPSVRNAALTMIAKTLSSTNKRRLISREKAVSALCVGLLEAGIAAAPTTTTTTTNANAIEKVDDNSLPSTVSAKPKAKTSTKKLFVTRVVARRSLEILFKLKDHLRPYEVAEYVVPSLVVFIQTLTQSKEAKAEEEEVEVEAVKDDEAGRSAKKDSVFSDPYVRHILKERKEHLYLTDNLIREATTAFESFVVSLRDASDKDLKWEREIEERVAAKRKQMLEKRRQERKLAPLAAAASTVDGGDGASADAADASSKRNSTLEANHDEEDEKEQNLPQIRIPPPPKRWSDPATCTKQITPAALLNICFPSSSPRCATAVRPIPKNPAWDLVGTFGPIPIPSFIAHPSSPQPKKHNQQTTQQQQQEHDATADSGDAAASNTSTSAPSSSQSPSSPLPLRKELYYFSFDDYDNEWNNAPIFAIDRLAIDDSAQPQKGASTRLHPLSNKLPSRCGVLVSSSEATNLSFSSSAGGGAVSTTGHGDMMESLNLLGGSKKRKGRRALTNQEDITDTTTISSTTTNNDTTTNSNNTKGDTSNISRRREKGEEEEEGGEHVASEHDGGARSSTVEDDHEKGTKDSVSFTSGTNARRPSHPRECEIRNEQEVGDSSTATATTAALFGDGTLAITAGNDRKGGRRRARLAAAVAEDETEEILVREPSNTEKGTVTTVETSVRAESEESHCLAAAKAELEEQEAVPPPTNPVSGSSSSRRGAEGAIETTTPTTKGAKKNAPDSMDGNSGGSKTINATAAAAKTDHRGGGERVSPMLKSCDTQSSAEGIGEIVPTATKASATDGWGHADFGGTSSGFATETGSGWGHWGGDPAVAKTATSDGKEADLHAHPQRRASHDSTQNSAVPTHEHQPPSKAGDASAAVPVVQASATSAAASTSGRKQTSNKIHRRTLHHASDVESEGTQTDLTSAATVASDTTFTWSAASKLACEGGAPDGHASAKNKVEDPRDLMIGGIRVVDNKALSEAMRSGASREILEVIAATQAQMTNHQHQHEQQHHLGTRPTRRVHHNTTDAPQESKHGQASVVGSSRPSTGTFVETANIVLNVNAPPPPRHMDAVDEFFSGHASTRSPAVVPFSGSGTTSTAGAAVSNLAAMRAIDDFFGGEHHQATSVNPLTSTRVPSVKPASADANRPSAASSSDSEFEL